MALTEERKQEIKKMILAGKNNSDINRALGCHPTNTTPAKVRKEMLDAWELNGILKEGKSSIPDPPFRKKKSEHSSSNDIAFLSRKLAELHEHDEGESGMNARYLLLLLNAS